jgi:hypothetical protein
LRVGKVILSVEIGEILSRGGMSRSNGHELKMNVPLPISSDDSISVNETRFSLLITSRFTQTRHTCVSHSQFSEPSHTSTTRFESGSQFAGKLSEFRPSTSLKESEDADARRRIAVLEVVM